MATPKPKAKKRSEIEETLDGLEAGIATTHAECDKLLGQLLSHTRSSGEQDLHPLFTRRGIRILGHYAFERTASTECRTALRCLNNVLVRAAPTRQIFVDEGYPEKVIALMKNGNPDDELPTASLLLFCSTGTSVNLVTNFERDDLAGIINTNIARHARTTFPPSSDPASPSTASLKLLSTLSVRYEGQAYRFLESLQPILEMINKITVLSPPLHTPVSLLINCLASIPIHQSELFPESAVDKLTGILQSAILAYGAREEQKLMPLLLVLYRVAQSESFAARSRLRARLLPSYQDRARPLGQGESLPHRLLHLGVTSMEPVREIIMSLFFELSGKDQSQFVQNVGLGNAAGFLASKGMQLSQDNSAGDGGTSGDSDFNPITGQRRRLEPQSSVPNMTMEEKEREAERLFVLFERLKSTGVVTIENPVAQALNSGRFEELRDDEPDS